MGYGILTCENDAQAWERAAVDKGDKGGTAVNACLHMVGIKHRLGLYPR
jgi:6,7-dimethyl-8-ribityllumazine synthase